MVNNDCTHLTIFVAIGFCLPFPCYLCPGDENASSLPDCCRTTSVPCISSNCSCCCSYHNKSSITTMSDTPRKDGKIRNKLENTSNCESIKEDLNAYGWKTVQERQSTHQGNVIQNCHFYSYVERTFASLENQNDSEENIYKGFKWSQDRNKLTDFQKAVPSFNDILDQGDDVYVDIPRDTLICAANDSDAEVNVTVVWFEDTSLFPVDDNNLELLSNRVISISINSNVSELLFPINITFYHKNTSVNSSWLRTCVFWEVNDNGNGAQWNSSSCRTDPQDNKTNCICSHLSFFAVLMSVRSVPLSLSTVHTLTLFSIIGCGMSAAFLALALLIFVLFRRKKCDHASYIHVNLCAALFFFNLSYIVNHSLSSTDLFVICIFIAAVTHYFLLCALTWFAIEGFHLYLLVVHVFNIYVRRYLLKLCLLSWGLPAVAVITIASCQKYGAHKIYIKEGGSVSVCWLLSCALSIANFTYMVLVVLLNTLVFAIVMVWMFRMRRQSPSLGEKGVTKQNVFSLLMLSWLLGLSWGLLLFQFGSLQEASFLFFTVTNSLHGPLLFLRQCLQIRHERSLQSTKTRSNQVTNPS